MTASAPVNGQSTIQFALADSLGGAPTLSTSVFMNVDDSQLYRANATSGSRTVSIVNGVASVALTSAVYGPVTVTTVDTLGNNFIAGSVSVTFPNIAAATADPAPGTAFVSGTVVLGGFPCDQFNTSVLSEFATSISVAMTVPIDQVNIIRVRCSSTNATLFRRTAPSGLNFGVRLALPSETLIAQTSSLLTTVTTPNGQGTSPLLSTFVSQPVVQSLLASNGATLTITAAVPQVAVSGVNCSADSWTAWSSCAYQRCGSGQGVQSRSRRCPAEAQTRLCNAPACGNCSVNNGGCATNATCTIASDGSAVCACTAAFLGDGITCFSRNASSSLSLIVNVLYPVSLSTVAPLAVDVLRLQNDLILKAMAILNILDSRVAFAQLLPDAAGFYFVLSIAPPSLPSDPTAADLQTTFSAAVTAGQMDLPTAGATLSSSSTSSSVFPSSSSASSSSGWTTVDSLYIAIAFAAFFAFVAIILALVLHRNRRSHDFAPTSKGPAWLAQPMATSRRSMAVDAGDDPLKKLTAVKSRNSIAPASPVEGVVSNPATVTRRQPSQWEIDAIENDLPSVPAVRHYYPGWGEESKGSPIAQSPWI